MDLNKIRGVLSSMRDNDIDYNNTIEHFTKEGSISSRFVFLAIISCAVATVGLLQSSPAVIIGAMLISPLMTPIMALGLGICIIDLKLILTSLKTIAIGMILSLFVSFLFVKLTPFDEPTIEIISRTKPNLLDLMSAIFSGLAGGYAAVHRKGETLVGVAIATALMPPLATSGYGLATGKLAIASGGFLLFSINLLAIAFSMTLIALWYGFSYKYGKNYGKKQVVIILLVLTAISMPLYKSLNHIIFESKAVSISKQIVLKYFSKANIAVKIVSFNINFNDRDNILIDSIILSKHYDSKAEKQILKDLKAALKSDLKFSLDQLILKEETNLSDKLLPIK